MLLTTLRTLIPVFALVCLCSLTVQAGDDNVGTTTGGPLIAGFKPIYVGNYYFRYRSTYDKWLAVRHLVGNPTSNETQGAKSPTGVQGTYVVCERGVLTRIQSGVLMGRTCMVRGDIAKLYAQMGGSGSVIGWPVGDEYEFNTAGHDAQHFERAKIRWAQGLHSWQVVAGNHQN